MRRPTRRVRSNPFFRTVARLCRQYLKWYGNASYKLEKNGERRLLGTLRGERFATILDVGANVGKWASLATAAFPAATVYALEIVPATFERLCAATASLPRVRPINLGFADHTGRLRIRYEPSASAHATFTEYPHGWVGERIECDVTTGDAFLETQALSTVDFLKVDVEGAEHLVFQGFARALADRRVRFVQFEYGLVNILTGFLLKHFYDLFGRYGYVVGKIYPDYVDIRDYTLADEDFLGPNYLACRHDEPLLSLLRGGS
ncbi:MAG: FkbM family methyltransferase [Gemmatimonadales bacterium]